MSSWEIIRQAMNEGLCIRRKDHKPGYYFRYSSLREDWVDEKGDVAAPTFSDLIAYEFYKEPKQKVQLWKWLLMGKDGKYINTMYYYTSESKVVNAYASYSVIGKIESSMIEVKV